MTSLAQLAAGKRRRAQPEEAIHRAIVEWLRVAVPEPPEGPAWFHPPNGGGRSKAEAGIFKALGVKAGVPDLVFVWRKRVMGVEIKPPGRSLSSAQKERHDEWRLAGALLHTVHGIDELRQFLWVAGVPVRASA